MSCRWKFWSWGVFFNDFTSQSAGIVAWNLFDPTSEGLTRRTVPASNAWYTAAWIARRGNPERRFNVFKESGTPGLNSVVTSNFMVDQFFFLCLYPYMFFSRLFLTRLIIFLGLFHPWWYVAVIWIGIKCNNFFFFEEFFFFFLFDFFQLVRFELFPLVPVVSTVPLLSCLSSRAEPFFFLWGRWIFCMNPYIFFFF